MSQECQVQARFFQPPPELRRYFTTFYLVEFSVANGGQVVDYLHPEWANLRFMSGSFPDAETMTGAKISGVPFCVTGPSSKAIRFSIGPQARMWGVGLLPLGWAKFVRTNAGEMADALVDGGADPAFSSFVPLADTLFSGEADTAAEFARISHHFRDRPDTAVPDEARILAIHGALVDPDIKTVAEMVELSGVSQRTVERSCHHAFGFAPKLLLRRQRFLRSLADYMLDPSLKWIEAMDSQYHDQAQFVRDFKAFMGMSPSKYAALDKPILSAVMIARAQFVGKAVQALDTPDGGGA